jgi:hypothetical protein
MVDARQVRERPGFHRPQKLGGIQTVVNSVVTISLRHLFARQLWLLLVAGGERFLL